MRFFQQKLILNSEVTPIFVSCFSCTRTVAVSSPCRDVNCPINGECIFMSKMCNVVYCETKPNILLIDQKFELLSNVKAMERKEEHCHQNWSVVLKILGTNILIFFPFSFTRGSSTELLYQEIHYRETRLNYYEKFISSLIAVFSVGEKQSKPKQN